MLYAEFYLLLFQLRLFTFALIRNLRDTTINWASFWATTNTKYSFSGLWPLSSVYNRTHLLSDICLSSIIHSCPQMEVCVAIVTRKLQQKSMLHSFIGILCIPLAQSFHVKLSHWSSANVICMLRGNGISHIKFLREGGGLVGKGGVCRRFTKLSPVVGLVKDAAALLWLVSWIVMLNRIYLQRVCVG